MQTLLSRCLLFMLVVATSSGLLAQEKRFFVPREIQQAYAKGTRSYDGRPGANYWQNTADYQIAVTVDPSTRSLKGEETVTYYNNSPDKLDWVVIRLYNDAFRKGNARGTGVRPTDVTEEGVVINQFSANGQQLDVKNPRIANRSGTNMVVQLPESLPQGGKVTLQISWEQQIAQTTIRGGAYDSTSFFVSYWYPQMAVYDDVFGWDNLSYDFSTEFYNNLGNFDVKITAPKNFTVLSTGVLQNPDEVLAPTQLTRYRQAQSATETVRLITPDDLAAGIEHKSGTWHYQASEVSDFAFCLSDHFCWDAATQTVSGNPVLIHTYYQQNLAQTAGGVTAMQQKTMKHFSEDFPGIPYPYPEFCTFISGDQGGGMEYPMMANNGGPNLGVTVHEMFHTYFPMYVRVNEKRFAWMDEGWADFSTSYVINRYFQNNDGPLFGEFSPGVSGTLGTISDLPLITSTQFMDNTNYGYASYPLPAFVYAMLHQHLGDALFKQCFQEYIRRWAKKSPTPYDFFYTFEQVSKQDLAWLWKPWFFEQGTADVAIHSWNKGKLVLENKGQRPVPITLQVEYQDGNTEELIYSPGVWQGASMHVLKVPRGKEVASLSVNGNVPDAELLNNFYPPLQDRYKQKAIAADLEGTYRLREFPVDAIIARKEGILSLAIPAGGINAYLLPTAEDGKFTSVDGSMKVEFTQTSGKTSEIAIELFGTRVSGAKQ